MSGIGGMFKRFIEPGAFGDESAAPGEDQPQRSQRRVEQAEFDAAKPAYDRAKNLGKHLHPKKVVEDGLGSKFRETVNMKKVSPVSKIRDIQGGNQGPRG